jgi:hypothetical protein
MYVYIGSTSQSYIFNNDSFNDLDENLGEKFTKLIDRAGVCSSLTLLITDSNT